VYSYQVSSPKSYSKPSQPLKSRVVYSAAHVVCNPLDNINPLSEVSIDWAETMNYRRYLWSLGLGVAEAMDTAQRGMGLDWNNTKKLISYSLQEAKTVNGGIACGAGTDQLSVTSNVTLSEVIEAYLEQCEYIESRGGKVILMASKALAACATTPEDYFDVYDTILKKVKGPVILHWLGEDFDPSLSGYWGFKDAHLAMEACLEIIHKHSKKIDGIKISLLDPALEVEMRTKLPGGVKMYTGDDFNYPELIQGDESSYSHALLGIFDAIAPAASAAIQALDEGNVERCRSILDSTLPLSRHIFQRPTYYYKTGIVFLAYLNGHQKHFRMLSGLESARSVQHLSQLFILADQAGLLIDPDLAMYRMKSFLNVSGVLNSL
ncbi:dihydrodipicolinate synthase family protein, partial [Priestia megaterium]|uniref:dihydrodipicolinate synthase family protein n=1 Tax=Priestia megaterium TaxID=1404 RepID=UPI003390B426